MSHAHDDEFGPKSAHTVREEEEKAGKRGTDMPSIPSDGGPPKYKNNNAQVGPYSFEAARDDTPVA